MRFVRSLWARVREDRSWTWLAACSFVGIVFILAGGAKAADLMPLLVGVWVGVFLVHIAFRVFGWGRFAANLLLWTGFAAFVSIIVFAPRSLFDDAIPMWVKVVCGAVAGFLSGAPDHRANTRSGT